MGSGAWFMLLFGGAALVTAELLAMKKTGENLKTRPVPSGIRTTLEAFIIRLDVELSNPTDGKLKMRYPDVSLGYQGYVLVTSQTKEEILLIPAKGKTWIRGLEFHLPWKDFPSLAPLLSRLISGEKKTIDLEIGIATQVYLGPVPITFRSLEKVSLTNPYPHASQQ